MKKLVVILALAVGMLFTGEAHAKSLKIDGERLIVLKGGINTQSSDKVIKGLNDLDDDTKNRIWLVINSPGGSVPAGLRLAAAMEGTTAPIYCVVDTRAHSMAAILTQFCDKTYAQKYATIMFHQASFSVGGEESQVSSRYKHTMTYLYALHVEVAKKLNISFGRYRKLIRNEWWMTADQALKAKVIDGVIIGLKYEFDQSQMYSVPFFLDEDFALEIMMCGPTTDSTDPCYGIYKGAHSIGND